MIETNKQGLEKSKLDGENARFFVAENHKHFWRFGCNTLYVLCMGFVCMLYIACMYNVYTSVVKLT